MSVSCRVSESPIYVLSLRLAKRTDGAHRGERLKKSLNVEQFVLVDQTGGSREKPDIIVNNNTKFTKAFDGEGRYLPDHATHPTGNQTTCCSFSCSLSDGGERSGGTGNLLPVRVSGIKASKYQSHGQASCPWHPGQPVLAAESSPAAGWRWRLAASVFF